MSAVTPADTAPTSSRKAMRLLDRFAEAVRSQNDMRARGELAAFITALEAENEQLRARIGGATRPE